MKFALFALVLLSSASAMARDFDAPSDVGAPRMRYLSWCLNNTVMEKTPAGVTKAKQNCAKTGQVCAEEEVAMGGEWVAYAHCVDRQ
jgi:hypothetical protein